MSMAKMYELLKPAAPKAEWMDLKYRSFKIDGEDFVLDEDGEQILTNKWNAGSVACFLTDETRGCFKMSINIDHLVDDLILNAVITNDGSSLPEWLTLADFTFKVEENEYNSKDLKELIEQVGFDIAKTLGIQMKASVKNQKIDDDTFEKLLVLKRENYNPADQTYLYEDSRPIAQPQPRPAPAPVPEPAPAPRPRPML